MRSWTTLMAALFCLCGIPRRGFALQQLSFQSSPPPPHQQATDDDFHSSIKSSSASRRDICRLVAFTAVATSTPKVPGAAAAAEPNSMYVGSVKKSSISYRLELPPTFQESKKPVQTHYDELLFSSSSNNKDDEALKRASFGISIDPLRITSLHEFGTPEEIAARVVTAEVNRDGIFQVTLLKDPYQAPDGSFVSLQYLSDGKRGKKVFWTKIFVVPDEGAGVAPAFLCVLTAQMKEQDYETYQDTFQKAVDSFTVFSSK